MALVQTVENGKFVESASQSSLSASVANKNSVDKDSFLQLLVAQMQYQDPLEPTSNTEYISQYAQFTQVEELQNMAASTNLMRASSLVGQEVYVKTTSSTGDTKYIQGKVDYVVYENGKAFLSIDESLYSIDDLDTVVDAEYLSAYNKAYDFSVRLNKLPGINSVDLTDAKEIDELESIYNEMTEYERTFVTEETAKNLNKYIEKLKALKVDDASKAEEETEPDGVEDMDGTKE